MLIYKKKFHAAIGADWLISKLMNAPLWRPMGEAGRVPSPRFLNAPHQRDAPPPCDSDTKNSLDLGIFLMRFIFALLIVVTAKYSHADSTEAPQCLKYDKYNHKGSELTYPSNCDSIFPELGGLREFMYERGWNAQALVSNAVNYDLRHHDHGEQLYAGQKPTLTSSATLILTHDLERIGFPQGSLLTFAGSNFHTSFRGSAVREAFVSQLSVRIPLYQDRLIVQIGYYGLADQFYGSSIGNNIAASTLGPGSALLFQLGAQGFKPAPAFDVRFYSEDKRYYGHFGIARSISPGDPFGDSDKNRSGLVFETKDAKTVMINEVGYRVEAASNQKKVWLRGGVAYNASPYKRVDDYKKTSPNFGFYALGDLQLTQPSAALPYKGWYLNAYVNWARDDINLYARAVGGTLYSLAPFDTRPYDILSFSFSKSYYSRWTRLTAAMANRESAKASSVYSVAYTARLSRGTYLQSALLYTRNPTFTPKRPDALSLNLGLVLVF